MARPNSLQSKIENRITESGEYVFLTREFTDLGGRRQVLRALRKIVAEGRLVRLGCGVYGLASPNGSSDRPTLHHPEGFPGAARTALTKLGVEWEATGGEAVVRIKRRFSRRLRFEQAELLVER